ncbi:MAG TPA: hypothetical protein VHE79_10515, partial [Spirochaetia bacterium]
VPVVPQSVVSYFTSTFQGRHVETVIVDGNVVVQNGAMTTVNEEEVRAACIAEARTLWKKNGITV